MQKLSFMAKIFRNHRLLLLSRSPNWSFPLIGVNSRSIETLAYEEINSSTNDETPKKATIFFLHGLLGSGRNWRSFSRNLASVLSKSSSSPIDWRIVLVDLRNHGSSAEIKGLEPPHDLVNAARDLADLVKSRGWAWPDAVIGHSMGGKVALQFAQSCGAGDYGESAILPKQLWVLDSAPGEVEARDSDGEVEKVLQTLQSLPTLIPSRNETNYWPLLEHPPKGLEIAVVRAENSDRWSPNVVQQLENIASRRKSKMREEPRFMFFRDLGTGYMSIIPRDCLKSWPPV
ncbi:hypothetical protein Syun_016623 [Stephania yunnanensis]|uniref:AB hydrolase-1 domain-containing protein n=1 Tax=Stephania yunnanensis TaxID=152371 RepID=A0AAP0P532_9MAGN